MNEKEIAEIRRRFNPKRSNINHIRGCCVSTEGEILAEFDRIVGLEKLKAIHLNDSMNELGSHKDRHAKIGEGNIGLKAFERIINHERLRQLPFYLETPNELEGYAGEIALLRSKYLE